MSIEILKLKAAVLPQFDMVIHPRNDREENSFYYKRYVFDWEKEWKKDIKNHPNYDQIDKDFIIDFIKHQTFIILNTTKLFRFVHRYKEPSPGLTVKIAMAQADVERSLEAIGNYENELKHRVRQKEFSLALDIQSEFLLIFQESLNILKANCQIDVFRAPIGELFKAGEKKLKKSVNRKDIDLRQKIKDNEAEKAKTIQLGRSRDHEKMIWFQVGLKFATGEIKKYPHPEYSAPQIAEAIGLPSGEKYILAGINGYKSDKDIYASRMKMQTIINYCQENDIPIDPDFLSSTPSE